ncbi:MAG: type IV toxin-antitoxin system AbiEi family antitoxin domain-containing protein [Sedimentisphaerales bacterium]|nr:type IV toxin-antitoxin system AbiEi family antitoxin domain-containing protein [Sedimentisphaerales bacterium]
MKLQELYAKRPVLTLDELLRDIDEGYSPKKRSRESLVAYHQREGRLLRIRRGLYAVVPPGSSPEDSPVDPYLVAAKSADDAVLAYHTALEVHGKAHSVFERFFFQSNKSLRPTTFRTYRFECVLFPKALRDKGKQEFATTRVDRSGLEIRVASLERTLVDLLDRPDLGGGWEEVWRSLESVEYFDLDLVINYVELLAKKTTAAKVGYYLQQHAEQLMVEDRHLDPLRQLRPKQPHYLQRGQSDKLVNDWNLVVPRSLAERSWEEIA